MKISIFRIAAISLIFVLAACYTGCDEKSNLVFEKNEPTTKVYKDELAARLKANPSGLIYTFNKYFEGNGQDFLDVTIKDEDFKATGLVLVRNWNNLESIQNTKGAGYGGAELRGLQVEIQDNSEGAILLYQGLDKIVD